MVYISDKAGLELLKEPSSEVATVDGSFPLEAAKHQQSQVTSCSDFVLALNYEISEVSTVATALKAESGAPPKGSLGSHS